MALYRYRIGIFAFLLTVAQMTTAVTLKSPESTTNNSLLDLGCVILASPPDPIKIKPNPRAADPYSSYTGCGSMTLTCSFPAQIKVSATGNGAVTAKWNTTVRPALLKQGTTKVGICVNATGLTILDNFQAGTTVRVAELVVTIIPL